MTDHDPYCDYGICLVCFPQLGKEPTMSDHDNELINVYFSKRVDCHTTMTVGQFKRLAGDDEALQDAVTVVSDPLSEEAQSPMYEYGNVYLDNVTPQEANLIMELEANGDEIDSAYPEITQLTLAAPGGGDLL